MVSPSAGDRSRLELRRDLFHRLRVIAIHVPSLRERIEDLARKLKRLGLRRPGTEAMST